MSHDSSSASPTARYRITERGSQIAMLYVRLYARGFRPAASLPTRGRRADYGPLRATECRPDQFPSAAVLPEKLDSSTQNYSGQRLKTKRSKSALSSSGPVG
jgi:hypothetical protein